MSGTQSEGRPRIAVIGLTGRVGRSIEPLLEVDFELDRLDRSSLASARTSPQAKSELVERVRRTTGLLNLAGMAHANRSAEPNAAAQQLAISNVALPLDMARIALAAHVTFIHLSSSKAELAARSQTLYGISKKFGEAMLESTLGDEFRQAGLPLIALRTKAVLAPPFDAGKLGLLKHLAPLSRFAPSLLSLPVTHPEALARTVSSLFSTDHTRAGFQVASVANDGLSPRQTLQLLTTHDD